MKKPSVSVGPGRASAGWQTMNASQFNHFNSQLRVFNALRPELQKVPLEERTLWLEGFLGMVRALFGEKDFMKAA